MRTFWRLLGFLRPYRRGVIVSFVLAGVAMGAGVLIPYLVGRTVDEIRQGGDQPLAARARDRRRRRAAARLQRRRAGWSRAASRSASSTTCATACTRTCSRSSSASSTRQQTGQLMSRATVDLQAVRFFLGYGLIFILQSPLTILIAAVVMFVARTRARR